MPDAAAVYVEEARLRLSRAASAELAGAALRAQEAAGLDSADFIVVAVPPGAAAGGAARAAEEAARGVLDEALARSRRG